MSFGLSLLLIAGLVAAFMLTGGATPARAEVANGCQPGTYHDGTGCVPAPAGSFVATSNATAATQCSPGRYQNLEGQTSCLEAPAGTFVATVGAIAATSCSPGTYQPAAGSILCLQADPGFFVDYIGAAEQTPCPAGTTTLFAAAVECTPIDAGYRFSGFSAPVDADAMNVAKAGQAIPLKFHVSDSSGAPVTDLTDVTVTVTSLSCSAATTVDVVEEYATGGSGLQNLGDGFYQYNWKTPKSYAFSCRTMSLGLGDGAQHTAQFQFRK